MKKDVSLDSKENAMSRRAFVAGATALGIGSLSLAGCSATKTSSTKDSSKAKEQELVPTETKTVDVVVVGAGASGITCATHCAEKGLNTVLIEKMETLGGASNSVFSAFVRSPEEVGAEVDAWVADCHWRVDGTIIGNMLSNSEKVFAYLRDTWGWEYKELVSMGVKNWRIMTAYADRPGVYQNMVDTAGVDVHFNTTGKQLVTNESGAVTGIIVEESGAIVEYDAKAVVIATGGYAGNEEMVKEAFGRSPVCGGLPQNVGEGLKMCWAVGGAKPRNYGMQMPHQTYTDCTDDLAKSFDDFPAKYPLLTGYLPCFLNVTAQGKRFRNESYASTADPAANSSLYQGDFHWVIISAEQIAKMEQGGCAALNVSAKPSIPPKVAPTYELDTAWSNATAVFDQMVKDGHGAKGASAKELAEAAGMDPEVLSEAIKTYDAMCAAGNDTACGKDAAYMVPNGSGPYYAVYTYQNNLTSCGGVATDVEYRVLDEENNVIQGLYAIGVECMSNLYNDTYTGVGAAVCTVYTTGYLSAESILASK